MNKGFIFIPLEDSNSTIPPKRNTNNKKQRKKNNNNNNNYKKNYRNNNNNNNNNNNIYRKNTLTDFNINKSLNLPKVFQSDINTCKLNNELNNEKNNRKISDNFLNNFFINQDLNNKKKFSKTINSKKDSEITISFNKENNNNNNINDVIKKDKILKDSSKKEGKDDSFNFILPLNNDMNLKKPENIFSFFLNPSMEKDKNKIEIENVEKKKELDNYREKILDGEIINEKISNLDDLIKLSESDKYQDNTIYNIDMKSLKKMNKPLKKLKSMIGLSDIKEKLFYQLIFYLQGLDVKNKDMLHSVISGPPGVGKTELAKILSEIYSSLGILSKGTFNIAKRSDLIGSYLGSTAMKTSKILEDSKGGVLFIDEAYSLGNSEGKDIYSKECIDTINQFLSENREDFICIIAGYKDSLENCFFNYNSGLERRFPWKYDLKPYDSNQLKQIFEKIVKDNKWSCEVTEKLFKKHLKDFKYYGGDMENLFHKTKLIHGYRALNLTKEEKRIITEEDLNKGYNIFMEDKTKQTNNYFMYT